VSQCRPRPSEARQACAASCDRGSGEEFMSSRVCPVISHVRSALRRLRHRAAAHDASRRRRACSVGRAPRSAPRACAKRRSSACCSRARATYPSRCREPAPRPPGRSARQPSRTRTGPAFRAARDLEHIVRVDELRRLHSLAVNVPSTRCLNLYLRLIQSEEHVKRQIRLGKPWPEALFPER
jgi:hypothetical protein